LGAFQMCNAAVQFGLMAKRRRSGNTVLSKEAKSRW